MAQIKTAEASTLEVQVVDALLKEKTTGYLVSSHGPRERVMEKIQKSREKNLLEQKRRKEEKLMVFVNDIRDRFVLRLTDFCQVLFERKSDDDGALKEFPADELSVLIDEFMARTRQKILWGGILGLAPLCINFYLWWITSSPRGFWFFFLTLAIFGIGYFAFIKTFFYELTTWWGRYRILKKADGDAWKDKVIQSILAGNKIKRV